MGFVNTNPRYACSTLRLLAGMEFTPPNLSLYFLVLGFHRLIAPYTPSSWFGPPNSSLYSLILVFTALLRIKGVLLTSD